VTTTETPTTYFTAVSCSDWFGLMPPLDKYVLFTNTNTFKPQSGFQRILYQQVLTSMNYDTGLSSASQSLHRTTKLSCRRRRDDREKLNHLLYGGPLQRLVRSLHYSYPVTETNRRFRVMFPVP
jgi:hypothetical protein